MNDIIRDDECLYSPELIEGYFTDCYHEYFDCGQGYYEDEVTLFCQIGEKYYKVLLEAEVVSAKQDNGDRLYWVDCIHKVEWEEVSYSDILDVHIGYVENEILSMESHLEVAQAKLNELKSEKGAYKPTKRLK